MSVRKNKAPFPYFGGKSRIAPLIWDAFGRDVPNYVEPFCGSAAMLLARPGGAGTVETINDADGFVSNFWRSMVVAPDDVAHHADWPVNEADMHARSLWMIEHRRVFTSQVMDDPEWCDPKIAGWWAWGASTSIMGNWCSKSSLGARPHLGPGLGVHSSRLSMPALAQRLRHVRVLCGDWRRAVSSDSALGLPWRPRCGVFLDPPYAAEAGRDGRLYGETDDLDVSHSVREWAIERGDDPRLRIALCGYEGEHNMPTTWRVMEWHAHGGMAHLGDGRGKANASRERVWLSPHCINGEQMGLGL